MSWQHYTPFLENLQYFFEYILQKSSLPQNTSFSEIIGLCWLLGTSVQKNEQNTYD